MSILQKLDQPEFNIKMRANGYYYDVRVVPKGGKLQLFFGYNKDLLAEVKESFEGRRFDWDLKTWEVPLTQRNLFRLEVLQGKYSDVKPYAQFDRLSQVDCREMIQQHCAERKIQIYKHQEDLINQAYIVHFFVWAAEMGVGKTLAAIILMELAKKNLGIDDWFWVGPKSALISVKIDFEKWQTKIRPNFYTYEAIRDVVEKWPPGKTAPQGLILDEASRAKNSTAKRTQAVKYLADNMRQDHGTDCFVGLLSGTPAPKSPIDWWSLCEIACPGYMREGHVNAFKARLAIVEKRETVPGAGAYDHVVAWKNSDDMCGTCGCPAKHLNHTSDPTDRQYLTVECKQTQTYEIHKPTPCVNEVAKLKKAMSGLVAVKLKEECTDLPAKRYEVIRVKPSRQTLNLAKLIAARTSRSIEANILLRELSDGFQYQEVGTGQFKDCPLCKGHGTTVKYVDSADVSRSLTDEEVIGHCRFVWSQPTVEDDPDYFTPEVIDRIPVTVVEERVTCTNCDGKRQVEIMERKTVEVDCPKDQVVKDLLERHEECGRLVFYGGFTGSIQRLVKLCLGEKWAVIKADGGGWEGWDANGVKIVTPGNKADHSQELMKIFMRHPSYADEYPDVAFIGQPGAAGMGLTLTASPTIVFFSNDFNGESRWQAEDRGHRLGMDRIRGGLIIDIIHLPTDEKVLENLQKKKDLQYMSMTGILKALTEG